MDVSLSLHFFFNHLADPRSKHLLNDAWVFHILRKVPFDDKQGLESENSGISEVKRDVGRPVCTGRADTEILHHIKDHPPFKRVDGCLACITSNVWRHGVRDTP